MPHFMNGQGQIWSSNVSWFFNVQISDLHCIWLGDKFIENGLQSGLEIRTQKT